MGETTEIAWCDATFNPWIGCTKISPGCDHCYAEGWAKRSGLVKWGFDRRRTSAANWRKPLKWNAGATAELLRNPSRPRPRVFCASLSDVFDNEVPDEWRASLFTLIRMTPSLDYLLLTKRVGNALALVQRAISACTEIIDATQTGRTYSLQSSRDRRIGDRLRGEGLAPKETNLRSLDGGYQDYTMQESACRDRKGGELSSSQGDVRGEATLRGSTSARVASLQGSNPGWDHDQSRGRDKITQSPGQFGASDVQRSENPRDHEIGSAALGLPRRTTPEGYIDGGKRQIGTDPPSERRANNDHREEPWSPTQRHFRPLSRGDVEAYQETRDWLNAWLDGVSPPNIWLGITVVNQEEADRDIPKLVSIPARVRFLSVEPMLGPVILPIGHVMTGFPQHITSSGRAIGAPLAIRWVICGGESGSHARPMELEWVRSLRYQCTNAGVAFFMKQLSQADRSSFRDFDSFPPELQVRQWPTTH